MRGPAQLSFQAVQSASAPFSRLFVGSCNNASRSLQRCGMRPLPLLIMARQIQALGPSPFAVPMGTSFQRERLHGSPSRFNLKSPRSPFCEQPVDTLWILRGRGANKQLILCVYPLDKICKTNSDRSVPLAAPAPLWIDVHNTAPFHRFSTTFTRQSTLRRIA
jgi:hypothetical protein